MGAAHIVPILYAEKTVNKLTSAVTDQLYQLYSYAHPRDERLEVVVVEGGRLVDPRVQLAAGQVARQAETRVVHPKCDHPSAPLEIKAMFSAHLFADAVGH